jgi:hypothetical protein
VGLGRQPDTQRLVTGEPGVALARTAQAQLHHGPPLTEEPQACGDTTLTVAVATHPQSATQSRRLTHGKPLTRGKMGNAYAAASAPLGQGTSTCPPSLAASRGFLPRPPPASSSPCSCQGVTPVLPAMACPWSTRSRRP